MKSLLAEGEGKDLLEQTVNEFWRWWVTGGEEVPTRDGDTSSRPGSAVRGFVCHGRYSVEAGEANWTDSHERGTSSPGTPSSLSRPSRPRAVSGAAAPSARGAQTRGWKGRLPSGETGVQHGGAAMNVAKTLCLPIVTENNVLFLNLYFDSLGHTLQRIIHTCVKSCSSTWSLSSELCCASSSSVSGSCSKSASPRSRYGRPGWTYLRASPKQGWSLGLVRTAMFQRWIKAGGKKWDPGVSTQQVALTTMAFGEEEGNPVLSILQNYQQFYLNYCLQS